MNRTVFILTYEEQSFTHIEAVFETKEKAKDYLRNILKDWNWIQKDKYHINEYELH